MMDEVVTEASFNNGGSFKEAFYHANGIWNKIRDKDESELKGKYRNIMANKEGLNE
jgi:hypothetical protein